MAKSQTSNHQLAELYGRWALNSLVEVAYVLSHDVAVRPQNYQQLTAESANTLAGLRFKLGADPEWPDAFQRTLNFKVLFQVSLASPPVREAALLHVENPSDEMRNAFRVAVTNFRAQLAPLEGQGLSLVANQTRPIFERTVALFRDPAITGAFGMPAVPGENWPLDGNFSGRGANTIAEIVQGLGAVACLGGVFRRLSRAKSSARPLVPRLAVSLPQSKFLKLQRAAYYGSIAISGLMASKGDIDSTENIEAAYQWAKALQCLVPDVARAWKDFEYRATLTDLEWGMAPNPAGEITPVSAVGLAASTYTVHGEICCCSGDLDCDPTTQLTDFCSEYQCTHACTIV